MEMITDVDKPRSPTSSEEENITVNCNYHELGVTQTGGTPVVREGSGWRLLDENGKQKGEKFYRIDELEKISGVQYYVGESGSRLYVVDEDGNKVSSGHKSLEYLGGNSFEGVDGHREDKISV